MKFKSSGVVVNLEDCNIIFTLKLDYNLYVSLDLRYFLLNLIIELTKLFWFVL